MKVLSRSVLFGATGALFLGGCQAEGPFPSLAQRPAEREPLTDPVRAIPNVPSDSALRARLTELLALARAGQRAFDNTYPAAEAAARAAGAAESESWIAAQERISRAEAARAETGRALADLDRLAVERSNVPT